MSKVIKVGLVMKSLQADFFQAMQSGAIEFASSRSDIELICVGTQSQTEVEEQVALVRSLIRQGVDAIVLVPIDSKVLVAPAAEAVRAGIAVVKIDIMLDAEHLRHADVHIPFVGSDNLVEAYEVGKCLCAHLSAGDDVAIIEGLPTADNAQQRKAGFQKAIEESRLHVVASVPANWETGQAALVFDEVWKVRPQLKGVFCSNDAMALGVLDVMRQRETYLPIVGFDNDISAQPYLRDGKLLATVDIFSAQLAVFGIEHALKMLVGDAADEGVFLTPFLLID